MNEEQQFHLFIKQAKVEFGEVYLVEAEDETFVFRLLTRREYQDILKIADDKDMAEELICQMAVIYPGNINFSTDAAGLPSLLAPSIVNESGFGDRNKSQVYFEGYRGQMEGSFELQAEAAIQTAFPHITEEEMQDWTVEKLMRTLAKAEWVLRNIKGYPISFEQIKPEEGEAQEEQAPPTMREIGNELRKQGLDPMIEMQEHIIKPKPYAEFPFIAGVHYWKRDY